MRPNHAWPFLFALLAAGCGHDPAPPALPPAAVADAGTGVPGIFLNTARVELPRGGKIGGYGFGLLCVPPYNDIAWNQPPSWPRALTVGIADGLAAAGLGTAGQSGRTAPPAGAAVLSARVTGLDYDLCRRIDLWFGRRTGETGSAEVTVAWEMRRDGRLLFKGETVGTGGSDDPALTDSKLLIMANALADAARVLAQRPDFRDALSAGALEGTDTIASTAQSETTPPETLTEEADAGPTPAGGPLVTLRTPRARLTGLVLADGMLLVRDDHLARRLPDGDTDLTAALPDGRQVKAVLRWRDEGRGLALLALEGCACEPVPVRPRSPAPGTLLYAPEGGPPAMMAGRRTTPQGRRPCCWSIWPVTGPPRPFCWTAMDGWRPSPPDLCYRVIPPSTICPAGC
ncbi:trypsin-like peptidase domain-containing protein [Niveispirillum irakense]|uniref:trypsin-like peptidase domain-containing protein n=1 Tax=Niveispirillum irakense TaxID=34011 RepID=UPI00048BBB53|nr:trypsin-like peptidase domain-containing protein [Niveispirillum irakense]